MGVHGALQAEVPMIVMSGESQTLGENPDLDIEQQWYGGLSVGGTERYRREHHQMVAAGHQPVHALRERDPRRRNGAAHAEGADLSQRRAGAHAARLDAAGERARGAARAARAAASERSRKGRRRCCSRRKTRSSSPSIRAAIRRRSRRWSSLPICWRIPVTWGRGTNFCNFPTDHPLYLGVASYKHLKDADLVLLVGGRAPWYPPHHAARPRARSSPSTTISSKAT